MSIPTTSGHGTRLIDTVAGWLARHQWVIRALVVSYLVVLGALAFWPQVFDGKSFPWDFQGKYTTAPAFVSASIDSGDVPTWAQGTGAGLPIFEDPGSGVYYPLWWLSGVLSVPLTLNLMAKIQVVHVIVGSIGFVAMMRARRFPWFWSVCGATAFLLSAMFFGQSQHANFIRGFALFPWFIWSVTPRDGDRPWLRLAALPPLAYLAAASIYPGQLVSFPIMTATALATSIATRRELRTSRTAIALGLAGLSAAVALSAVWGSFSAALGAEIDRPNPATAAIRAATSLRGDDAAGLILNTFAFRADGTTLAWAVAVPIVIGLAGLRWRTVVDNLGITLVGLVAFTLGAVGAWEPAGDAMVALGPLFTSRFAFADYKVGLVTAVIVMGVAGWRNIVAHPQRALPRLGYAAVGIGLMVWVGTDGELVDATRREWAIALAVVASFAVVVALLRGKPGIALAILLIAVVGDGARTIADQRFASGSSWIADPPAEYVGERDAAVRDLAALLDDPPAARPARVPPFIDPEVRIQGAPPDSLGYIGLGYRLQRHGGLQTNALALTLADSSLTDLMLREWTAWTVDCAAIDCDGLTSLPSFDQWQESSAIRTTRYDQADIDYSVDVDRRVLFIENEVNHSSWAADDARVRPVSHDGALRAWVVEPGTYDFTSHYDTSAPRRTAMLLAMWAVLWAATVVVVTRRPRPRRGSQLPPSDSVNR